MNWLPLIFEAGGSRGTQDIWATSNVRAQTRKEPARLPPSLDFRRHLAIRQPNSTTAAPAAAAITEVTVPPPGASSMAK
jgi:hypothetical protein